MADARKRRRLTQVQLADLAGVSRLTVVRAEAGHGGLALSSWIKLLSALDLSLVEGMLQVLEDDPIGRAVVRARETLPRAIRQRRGEG